MSKTQTDFMNENTHKLKKKQRLNKKQKWRTKKPKFFWKLTLKLQQRSKTKTDKIQKLIDVATASDKWLGLKATQSIAISRHKQMMECRKSENITS